MSKDQLQSWLASPVVLNSSLEILYPCGHTAPAVVHALVYIVTFKVLQMLLVRIYATFQLVCNCTTVMGLIDIIRGRVITEH